MKVIINVVCRNAQQLTKIYQTLLFARGRICRECNKVYKLIIDESYDRYMQKHHSCEEDECD